MKTSFVFAVETRWLWDLRAQNIPAQVRFKREFTTVGGAATFIVTADSQYELRLNGNRIGRGPGRGLPGYWMADRYSLQLAPGKNCLELKVVHHGVGSFHGTVIHPGVAAQLTFEENKLLVTDSHWQSRVEPALLSPVPRRCCQQEFEEHYDGRIPASSWETPQLLETAAADAHAPYILRSIPFLSRIARYPVRIPEICTVKKPDYQWSFDPREWLNTSDKTANMCRANLLAELEFDAESEEEFRIWQHVFAGPYQWKMNGKPLEFSEDPAFPAGGIAEGRFQIGRNRLMVKYPPLFHLGLVSLAVWTKGTLNSETGWKWRILGPFSDQPERELSLGERYYFPPPFITPERFQPDADWQAFTDAFECGSLCSPKQWEQWCAPLYVSATTQLSAHPTGAAQVCDPDASCHDNGNWSMIAPPTTGDAVRFLFDFGDETVGHLEFELDAPAGTVVELCGFEFIQHDGHRNLSEDMNNALEYITHEGINRYESIYRYGLRYVYVTLRNFARPVALRMLRLQEETYPQCRRGSFQSSDPLLNRLWEISVRSVACCSEDTYTDCPSYEQVLWVGDARNESLVDLAVNGDPRLSEHCWRLCAATLKDHPLVPSQLPSAWENYIPAWSFLWMRWAEEHFQATGDRSFGKEALVFLERQIQQIKDYLNADGLFEMTAWNMFDWSPMDTPVHGVVTHQNCLLVQTLEQVATLADELDRNSLAQEWREMADALRQAINLHLWNEERQAYADCRHEDGTLSQVISRQTQTVAYTANVATGERRERCRQLLWEPLPDMVQAGSPFFMFFFLELLAQEGSGLEVLKTIRNYWGVQLQAGATTVWECYHPEAERWTRSHCHGWSAAPAFFLSRHLLGIHPAQPGFDKIRFAPLVGDLSWCRGTIPTPHGDLYCAWERIGDILRVTLRFPKMLPVQFNDWRIIRVTAGKLTPIEEAFYTLQQVTLELQQVQPHEQKG